MDLTTYELIKSSYRSRLLFRTEAEYRAAVGVSFETIRDRRDDEASLKIYYDILDSECRRQCGESLRLMMTHYIKASAACGGECLDWRQRRQLASRKKFCRWMFRRVSAPGKKMSVEEELKYSPRECDEALFDTFYPDGYEAGRVYDLVFVMLITFSVIPPYDLSAGRGRDVTDSEVKKSIDNFATLISLLRDDTPQMGVLPKPIVFDVTLTLLNNDTAELAAGYSVAKMWELLNRIEDACVAVSSPQMTADTEIAPTGYTMPGIWVDDKDEGQSRFWIFPENKLMAFCYQRSGCEWVMKPYEFVFYRRNGERGFQDSCLFATARGNEQIINNGGVMQPSEVVTAAYSLYDSDEYAPFGEIFFRPESGDAPPWFDWHSFRRLPSDDERHTRFIQVIADIYDTATPLSMFFRNTAPFLTDEMDALIAIDNEYIYVSDAPAPDRFVLRCDMEDGEHFWYEPVYHSSKPAGNLRNIVVTEEHPLYILPRFSDMDNPVSERHRRFAEACRNTDINSQITIYHTPKHPQGLLCFNNFSVIFPLADDCEELKRYGVMKITRRDDIFV